MHKVFLLFFILFISPEVFSQDSLSVETKQTVQYDTQDSVSPLQFDSEKIETYKNDKEFNYTEQKAEEVSWWEEFKTWLRNLWNSFWSWLLKDLKYNNFFSFLLHILPYLIILGIIIFVIWLLYKLNPGAIVFKSKEKPEVFFSEEEEIIRSKDIEKLIQKALQDKDYRLAVRYYYLLILKKLTQAELIEYEFDKTNSDYITEIASEAINFPFKKVTNIYDYIWYGNFSVTEIDYQKAQKTFKELEHKIPKTID